MAEIIQRVFRGRVREVNTEKFTVEAVVSDESVDSYNEIILADAWTKGLKRYKSHPVLLSSHRYGDLTSQIGTGKKIGVDNNELVTLFQYFVGEGNAQADWGFKLAEKGLAAFSVGFIPKAMMDDAELEEFCKGRKVKPRRVYKEVELLEISQVVIPANANALQKGVEDEDPVVKTLATEIGADDVVKSLVAAGGDPITEPVLREGAPAWAKEMLNILKQMASHMANMLDSMKDSKKSHDELMEQVDVLEDRITEMDHALAAKTAGDDPPADPPTDPPADPPADHASESYIKGIFDSLKGAEDVLKKGE